ncbi:MAG: MltA domain-containing protein, partial [Bilophila sp.]
MFRIRLIPFVLCAALLGGCAVTPRPATVPPRPEVPEVQVAPLAVQGLFPVSEEESRRLSKALSPASQGLPSWKSMTFAVDQSLAHTRAKPAKRVAFGSSDVRITYGQMANALARLKTLLPLLDTEPELLATEFRWMRMGPDFGFTGYYEPEIPASPVRTERFKCPIYKTPPDLKKHRRGTYHTRHQIDCKGALRGRGLELAWVEDAVDVFILQIQGSGRLRYADGTVHYVLYDAQNGHKYVSLGRVMIDRGLLLREEVNMQAIRDWLRTHPESKTELLDTNPSYVFFKPGGAALAGNPTSDTPSGKGNKAGNGSRGSMGRLLTPWVSVATDQGILPN